MQVSQEEFDVPKKKYNNGVKRKSRVENRKGKLDIGKRKDPNYQTEWNKANPDKCRNKALKFLYGITLEEYTVMFEKQQGCCAICNTHQLNLKRQLCVDHCHSTMKVRGLLCDNCNHLLGKAKDNTTILQAAFNYLREKV